MIRTSPRNGSINERAKNKTKRNHRKNAFKKDRMTSFKYFEIPMNLPCGSRNSEID